MQIPKDYIIVRICWLSLMSEMEGTLYDAIKR